MVKNNLLYLEKLEPEDISTDILFCTGTTLINDTLEKILEFFKNRVQKILIVGPSVSMIPDILFDYGVNIVGGMTISDSRTTLKVLQERGGTKVFNGKKYNLIKD